MISADSDHTSKAQPSKLAALFLGLIWLSVLGSLLTLVPQSYLLGGLNVPLEINTNFGSYYLFIHLLSVVLLLFVFRGKYRGRRLVLGYGIALIIWQLAPLVPFLVDFDDEKPCSSCRTFTLLYANLYSGNKTMQALVSEIQTREPDIVALLEVRSAALQGVLDFRSRYPYSSEVPRDDDFGLALYSKFKFINEPLTDIGMDVPPAIIAALDLGMATPLSLALFHVTPPVSSRALEKNKRIVRRIATMFRHDSPNFLAVADMNATPHSPYYQLFEKTGGLRHVLYGEGLFRTWNAFNSLLRFQIDHIFYRGHIERESVQKLDSHGSDHFPIFVRFRISEASNSPAPMIAQ